MAQANGATVAGLPELEAFQGLPDDQKRLTESLRGVLAEVATTGRIRYKWSLLRPLVMFVMERVVQEYEEASTVEVGPSRPLPHDESVAAMLDRFRSYCWHFQDAPWTLQRLCELLLEPQKQYARLHKLALALEKLLLVTSEVPVSEQLPPRPLLAELGPVNDNPPKVPQPGTQLAGSKRRREEDGPGMGMAAATFEIVSLPGQSSSSQMVADGVSTSGQERADSAGSPQQGQPPADGQQQQQQEQVHQGQEQQEQQQQQQQQQRHGPGMETGGPISDEGTGDGHGASCTVGRQPQHQPEQQDQHMDDPHPSASTAPGDDLAPQDPPAVSMNGVQAATNVDDVTTSAPSSAAKGGAQSPAQLANGHALSGAAPGNSTEHNSSAQPAATVEVMQA